jgi:hypothetical protein
MIFYTALCTSGLTRLATNTCSFMKFHQMSPSQLLVKSWRYSLMVKCIEMLRDFSTTLHTYYSYANRIDYLVGAYYMYIVNILLWCCPIWYVFDFLLFIYFWSDLVEIKIVIEPRPLVFDDPSINTNSVSGAGRIGVRGGGGSIM